MKNSELREKIESSSNPIIEGNTTTIVWKGESAPELMGDFSDWEQGPTIRLKPAGKDLWIYQAEFPRDAYIEYAFWDGAKRVPDPLNPRRTPNGFGELNHYFRMPDSYPTPLALHKKGVPRGSLTRHIVPTWHLAGGDRRTVHLYQPPIGEPSPLLLVWDGNDFLKRGKLVQIVDNLIYQGRIQPIAIAFVENNKASRVLEYSCCESTLIFFQQIIHPLARQHLNLVDIDSAPGSFAVMGASMGGLMALYTAVRLHRLFGRVLSLSGAFNMADHEMVVFDLVEKMDLPLLTVWMTIGIYDFQSLLEPNQRMASLLSSRGHEVVHSEYNAGHNYPSWRDVVWRGLEYQFGPRRPPP